LFSAIHIRAERKAKEQKGELKQLRKFGKKKWRESILVRDAWW
jgi:hypothetical protein